MDAEQRSVFQGIVYYYRENMVNCRYQVTLKDAVDGALLQQALDAARAKAPYYFQKPVWEKKLLHLEPLQHQRSHVHFNRKKLTLYE